MIPDTPIVTYLRVSTDRQGQSGLGLDAQRIAVAAYVAARPVLGEFVEVESGRKDDRPQLAAALALCRQRSAVLVIAKLDRLARSVAFISNLMVSGVEFMAADMPQANRLTVHILAAVAEHEREVTAQRTKAALAAAKARGTRLGNPRPDLAGMRAAVALRVTSFRREVFPIIQELKNEGLSLRAIAIRMNELGLTAPRGGVWHAGSIRVVIQGSGS